ncbi:MAG: caspase domain-containing protein [Burkholderiales bacterium]
MFPLGLLAQQRNLASAPRHALVIGNSAYQGNSLKNPVNDATDIGGALKGAGFQVRQVLDAGRAQMSDAIKAYGEALARDGAVGVFYFAGHGAQLNWRNFLIPVDGQFKDQKDIPERAVDLIELVESLKRAKNPANIVILDACRNNPFGRDYLTEQHGLSQMDAPTGTILAYATAPGNFAIDGEGRNGLYTRNLLREMAVPEAKVEDVFKRVRLAVRRASKGLQVPWESTSLEDDVYFRPPAELRRLADDERAKLRDADFELWEKVKGAKEPSALEEYLRRYPSGNFADLAQVYLDRALKAQGEKPVETTSPAGNPYTAGTTRTDTAYRVGDFYTFRISDLYTNVVIREVTETVTAITDTEVIFDDGREIFDLLGNVTKRSDGRRYKGAQMLPLEFSVGRRWTTEFALVFPNGVESWNIIDFRIVGKERIAVPAGTFECFRVEGEGRAIGREFRIKVTYWGAPKVSRRSVAYEIHRQAGASKVIQAERWDLVAVKQQA